MVRTSVLAGIWSVCKNNFVRWYEWNLPIFFMWFWIRQLNSDIKNNKLTELTATFAQSTTNFDFLKLSFVFFPLILLFNKDKTKSVKWWNCWNEKKLLIDLTEVKAPSFAFAGLDVARQRDTLFHLKNEREQQSTGVGAL